MPEFEKIKLSILIHCYNNEDTIRELLENVKWADEIVICDSFSTDKTLEICREYTDKIYQYEHKNSADQKNWAIPKCKYDWILQVDTDERLTDQLIEEVKELLKETNIKFEAFKIPFKNYLFGKWIKGANNYPDYHERLFRRHLRFENKKIHAHLMVSGEVGILKSHILHIGWEDMQTIIRRFRRHRRLCLLQKKYQGNNYKFYHLVLRPPAMFLFLFFFKRGFIDGWRGVFFCGFFALLDFYVLKDFLFLRNKI